MSETTKTYRIRLRAPQSVEDCGWGYEPWLQGDYTTHPYVLVERLPDEPHTFRRWLPPRQCWRLIEAFQDQAAAIDGLRREVNIWACRNAGKLRHAHLLQTFEPRDFTATFNPDGATIPTETT